MATEDLSPRGRELLEAIVIAWQAFEPDPPRRPFNVSKQPFDHPNALDHLAATGLQIDDIDVEGLSPLGSDHLTLTGRYRIALAEALRDCSAYRELNAGTAVAA